MRTGTKSKASEKLVRYIREAIEKLEDIDTNFSPGTVIFRVSDAMHRLREAHEQAVKEAKP